MSREYSIVVELAKGLKPEGEIKSANSGYLWSLLDAKPGPSGLSPLETISMPITSPALTVTNWPFPQIIRGVGSTMLCDRTALYYIDESDWSTASITTYDATNPAAGKAITAGGTWHLAGFPGSGFLTNGSCFVLNVPGEVKTLVIDTPTVQAIEAHDERLFLGGLAGAARFATDDWGEVFDAWKAHVDKYDPMVTTEEDQAIGTNWVIWSEKGGGAFDRSFVSIIVAIWDPDAVSFDKIKSSIITQVEEGEIGMVQLPTKGAVLQIKELGDGVAVYTTDSVYVLRRLNTGYYRAERVLAVGSAGRGGATGDRGKHLFIDITGNAWSLLADGGVERLGYSEFLDGLTSANVVASFDPVEGDYYFADGTSGYLLSSGELAELSEFPTALLRGRDGTLAGYEGGSTPTEFSLQTGSIDFGFRGLKAVRYVEVDAAGISDLRVGALYVQGISVDPGGVSVIDTGWVPGGPEGIVFLGRIGTKFGIKVKGTMGGGGKVERIVVRFQYADSRSVRGPRVPASA